ncbi:MAG: DUF5106 domain-containing protein [Saprospiraceae bacterium]
MNIRLQVSGISEGRVYLFNVYKNKQSVVDSTEVEVGGRIAFSRPEILETGEYTVILPDQTQIQLLLDGDQVFDMATLASDPVRNMKVTGSLENELLYKSLQFDLECRASFEALGAQIKMLAENGQDYSQLLDQQQQIFRARNNFQIGLIQQYPDALFSSLWQAEQLPRIDEPRMPDGSIDRQAQRMLLRDHFWDMVNFDDTRLLHTKVIFSNLITYLDELTPPVTSEVIRSIDLLMDRVGDKPEYYRFFAQWFAEDYKAPEGPFMDPEAIYIYMVDKYLTRERAFWADSVQVYAWQLRTEDKKQSLTGQKGQNIEAKDTSGNVRALYDIRSPYIALFFYHAGCDHCKKETPKLVEFYREWKDKGVEIYAVALGTEDAEWKAFINEYHMDWINVTDKGVSDIRDKYSFPGTPEIYLLNPDRVIIGKHLRTEYLAWMITNDMEKSAFAKQK